MKLKGTYSLIAYPPILVASFYVTWLAGRLHLGYWPRSSLDDPKYIDGFWMWTYDFTLALLLLGLPLVVVSAVISLYRSKANKSSQWKLRLVGVVIGLTLILLAIGFILWDPHRVIEWYFD